MTRTLSTICLGLVALGAGWGCDRRNSPAEPTSIDAALRQDPQREPGHLLCDLSSAVGARRRRPVAGRRDGWVRARAVSHAGAGAAIRPPQRAVARQRGARRVLPVLGLPELRRPDRTIH